jgi:hypothetical protein
MQHSLYRTEIYKNAVGVGKCIFSCPNIFHNLWHQLIIYGFENLEAYPTMVSLIAIVSSNPAIGNISEEMNTREIWRHV